VNHPSKAGEEGKKGRFCECLRTPFLTSAKPTPVEGLIDGVSAQFESRVLANSATMRSLGGREVKANVMEILRTEEKSFHFALKATSALELGLSLDIERRKNASMTLARRSLSSPTFPFPA